MKHPLLFFVCSIMLIAEFWVVQATESMIELPLEQVKEKKKKVYSYKGKKFGLKSKANVLFVGKIGLGTPAQNLNFVFDTGSANILLNSARCTSSYCKRYASFDPKKSLTYKSLHRVFKVNFVRARTVNLLSRDNIRLNELTIPGQDIGEVIETWGDNSLFHATRSGILGLSLPGMKRKGTTTFLENVKKAKLFNKVVMGFYMHPLGVVGMGSFTLGGLNPKYYHEPIRYYKVKDPSYWKIKINKIRIGKKVINECEQGCYAFLDTGTAYNSFPREDYAKTKNMIKKEYKKAYKKGKKLPKLKFDIDDTTYSMGAKDYMIGGRKKLKKKSIPAIISSGLIDRQGHPLIILGQIFLCNYFSVYDYDRRMVGLAKAKHSPA